MEDEVGLGVKTGVLSLLSGVAVAGFGEGLNVSIVVIDADRICFIGDRDRRDDLANASWLKAGMLGIFSLGI